jgi:hypothetical protein
VLCDCDKKSLSDGRRIGESAVVCQGKTFFMWRDGAKAWSQLYLVTLSLSPYRSLMKSVGLLFRPMRGSLRMVFPVAAP